MAKASSPRKSWPWAKIALAVSLAFNLLIIGAIAGSHMGDRRHSERTGTVTGGLASSPYGRALAREDRKQLGATFRDRRAAQRSTREALRGIGLQIAEALRAEPYDPQAVAGLMGAQAKLTGDIQRGGQEALLDHLNQLEPAARMAYAARLEEIFNRRSRRRN